jgi:predicted NAD/FAD-binding protein
MAKVAIIGTGISGLTAAYQLNPHHDITIYERDPHVGGHTRTRVVNHGGREIPVDTGFIVYNERNYPNLTALFGRLGVAVEKSNMSFALTVRDGWLEWGAESANAIFAQRRNLFRPAFYSLFGQVLHFNENAIDAVEEYPDISLGELLTRMRLGDWFRWYYLLPMAGAIWSCPPRQMMAFPAATFIRFFANHGLLSASGQPQWYTVAGGSQSYVGKITAPYADRIRTNCGAALIARTEQGVVVRDTQGGVETYDHVVLASHADESLKLLSDADDEERATLRAFGYQRNRAVLHKNPQFMPRRKQCWASWVYHSDGNGDDAAITMSYWMNRLQNIDPNYPLFVTLNAGRTIPDEDVFDEHVFTHPVFDQAAIAAQPRVKAMQGRRNVWFCGAYLGYGFHEDGHASGLAAANALNAATGRPLHAILPLPSPARARATPEIRRPIAAQVALALRGSE